MKIGVIGTGHVGLVTCASLASIGHDVVGTDQDLEKIALLKKGGCPFHEPGLEDLLHKATAAGRLSFTELGADAVTGADVVFICVGTPPDARGEANMVAVEKAVRSVATHATGKCVVVEKSTVPTGTASRVKATLQRQNPELAGQIEVVCNPEFLREGRAVEDALNPDRILIGAESDWGFAQMRRVYEPLLAKGSRIFEFDIATAELAKHASNAFLALKISFINALARICERADADVVAVAEVMGSDPRIGRAFLDAGLGYGGSCFPKDLQAFERLAARLGYDFPLLREVARINEEALDSLIDKVQDALWNVEDKKVALLGLAFKPGTDDVRFAPALALAARLIERGARVVGYDPVALANAKAALPELEVANDPYEAATGAHCAVFCTEWEEFRDLDMEVLKKAMAEPVVVDGRNLFEPEQMRAAGFTYYPSGRPRVV